MQHQGLERGRGIELEAHRMQFGFGGYQVGAKAAQVLHQHQRVLLLLEEPHAHEGREVAVVAVVAQEHLGRRQRRPLGDGIHLDRLGLFFAEAARIEALPRDVALHVPPNRFELLEEFRIKHVGSLVSAGHHHVILERSNGPRSGCGAAVGMPVGQRRGDAGQRRHHADTVDGTPLQHRCAATGPHHHLRGNLLRSSIRPSTTRLGLVQPV